MPRTIESMRAQHIESEQNRQRAFMISSLVGLALAGITAGGAAILWQWVGTPEVRALVWPVFSIVSFFGLCGAAVAGALQFILGLVFSRESDRKVDAMIREATEGEQRKTSA